MKKFLLILLAIFVLLIGAAIAIPFLFKDKLVAYAKDAANENLEATVDFGDFGISLFKSFPNLTLTMEDVTVDGKNEFEGVRLARIGELTFTLDIMGLIAGDMELKKFGVSNSDIDVRVLEDGAANYNIMKETDEVEADTLEEASEFEFKLKAYYFNNINLKYSDATLAFDMVIEELNHKGSGDFTQDIFVLSTESDIKAMDVVFDGVTYLKRARLDAQMDIEVDMLVSKYTFSKNEIQLNELFLGVDGWVAMPEDPIDMDLKFYATKTEFRNILSLVPAEFASDLEGVDVTGTLALNGFAKGIYHEEDYPAFGLDMKVENGRFKYPDLPASAENIAVLCNISSPGGDLDRMIIDVSRFHLEMAGFPLDAHLLLKTPMSDPDIDAGLKTNMDLTNVSNVVPMEEELTGQLDADITMKGRYSSIENERYDEFQAGGYLNLKNFHYKDPEAYNVDINEAALTFNPQFAELSKFDMTIEDTDIRAQGRLDNYIAYALKDSTIVGSLNLQSTKIDLNKFMGDEEETATTTDTAAAEISEPIEIPANIRFAVNAEIGELIYDNINMKNVKGGINIANQIISLNNLRMDVLQGNVVLNGAYNAVNPVKPLVDFSYDAQNLDITETATTFNTVEKLAPLAKKATGKFSTKMTFTSELDQNLDPIMESIAGKGNFQSKDIYIEGFEPLNELARTLKIDRLSKQNIQDVKFNFEVREGRMYIEPFDVKIDQMNSTISGSTGLDQTIDYVMKLKIPTEMLQGPAMGVVQGLLGQANAALGSNMSIGDKVDVGVLVTGTIEKPIFKPSFGNTVNTQSVKDAVKEVVKEKIEEVKTEVIDKSVDEAKAQAAKLIAEAQKQSENLKAEAKKQADNIRAEGKRAAKRLEDEANNPITKAAAREAGKKLISEADKNAQKVEDEAAKRGDGIVNEAKKQGDKLISDAENKLR
jgi:hypothetical protein